MSKYSPMACILTSSSSSTLTEYRVLKIRVNSLNKVQCRIQGQEMASSNRLMSDDVVVRNMKAAMFKKTDTSLDDRVVSMTAIGNYVLIGSTSHGCRIYSVRDDGAKLVCTLGSEPRIVQKGGQKVPEGGSTCYDITASTEEIVFIKKEQSQHTLCVHKFQDALNGKMAPRSSLNIQQRAPMVVDFTLRVIAIGAGGWKDSWVSDSNTSQPQDLEGKETHIRTLGLDDFHVIKQWQAVDNTVSILRLQITDTQSMLGVADIRSGLKVFDLRLPTATSYSCLYQVPVEEIRNFDLLGNFVGVFHKFEPNVSFWNMREQKTILCINIQDQMKQLAEEYCEDDDDDSGLFVDDDDHVTCVTSVPYDEDHLLLYGTKSGCIFGMAVDTRSKLFSIPFAHESVNEQRFRKDVLGLAYVPKGKLVACYEGHGLTVLDFSPENPPDRPPTRGQAK